MLFNTIQFFVFLAVVLLLFYSSPRRFRKYIGIWIEKTPPGQRRRLILILSLAANLGFLGIFKYYNFAASNLALLLGKPANSFWFDIVLPLGISFHTFQSMSYVIDVYRGEQAAIRNPTDYALFICFFPQLVAGPIVRAHDFFRDLLGWRPPSANDVSRGLKSISIFPATRTWP
ncbi:MAG: hypothetical protein ABSB67_11975 [Bryobacteraceae bacterium]